MASIKHVFMFVLTQDTVIIIRNPTSLGYDILMKYSSKNKGT